ncbi:ABC transporter permease [Clostridium sp. 19966]|uniref:ABC transporter permease n=1 Tax=Clostridium sp. 19966 TaxID=2768166 RepID=UPI0028E0023B|nr:ABC transporter permease [Clostridium sp. 19966]MDT8718909.1 ABC transporter permease [Clostridium sp. 19966]
MKKILDIALLKIKLTLKDKSAMAMMLVAPLIFVLIFTQGFASNDSKDVRYPLSIVNNDNGNYSNKLIELLKEDGTFNIYIKNYDDAKTSVKEGKSAFAIVIPKNFSEDIAVEKNPSVETLKLQEDGNTTVLNTIVKNYLLQIRMGSAASNSAVNALKSAGKLTDGKSSDTKTSIEASYFDSIKASSAGYVSSKVTSTKDNSEALSITAIGLLIMFIMFFVTRGANSLMEEKDIGTWSRILSTPTKKYNIIGGFILGNFILGWIQVGLLIIISKNFFNVSWGNSVIALIILFSAFILAVVAFGISLTSFVKNKSQLSTLSTIIVMPTSLLAGCMWPRDIMPDIMIKISSFVPQTWALVGMKDLISRGASLNSVIMPSIMLILFTLFFFIVAVTALNFKKAAN